MLLNSRQLTLAVFSTLALGVSAQSQERTLSLTDAKKIAIARSPNLGSAQERLTQATWKIREAAAKYYPNLRFVSSATGYLRTPITERDSLQGRTRDPYVLFANYLESTYVLFDGFQRTFEKRGAEYQARAARALLADEHRLLALSVAKAYTGVLMAEENLALSSQRLALQEQLVSSFSESESASSGLTIGDIDSQYAQVAELERMREDVNIAQTDAMISRMVLAELLDEKSGNIESKLTTSATLSNETRQSLAKERDIQAVYDALTKRQDLEAASARIQAYNAVVRVEKASGIPRVVLNAHAGYQSVDGYEFNEENQDVYGGIRVEWDIFDGGIRRSRVKQAEAAQREASQSLMAKTAEVRREVLVARSEARSALNILEARTKAVDAATQKRNLAKDRFDGGIATMTEVMFAEQLLLNEQARLASAKIAALTAYENYTATNATNMPEMRASTKTPIGSAEKKKAKKKN